MTHQFLNYRHNSISCIFLSSSFISLLINIVI
nr:MAG TPA: hypothetical protein [Caudoviricetes sp.]